MTDIEIMEMQRRIDEGIHLAQKPLWERARNNRQTLIVTCNGKIIELMPEGAPSAAFCCTGDPLKRRWKNR